MTSRDRIRALLNRELPDRMGVYEHFWPETLRDVWPEQGYPKDADPYRHFDYDIYPAGLWLDATPFPGRNEVIEETDEWQVVRNGHGASLKYWKAKSGTPEHVAFEVTTPEKWAVYREPLLATEVSRLGDMPAQKAAMDAARERGKFIVSGHLFVFEMLRGTIGDESFLPALLLEPDWIRDFCQVYLNHYRRHFEILFREVGLPDAMFIYEDFGYTNGLFCSPRVLADLIMPYEKELVDFFKSYGLQVILHSCGDVREAIPMIVDAGFDCLQPMEAKAGCDVVQIAEIWKNKLAYMGNIDVIKLLTNDPAQVEAEVLPKLAKLKEMRIPYIFHSDHSIPPEINLATYEYALKLFSENNEY